MQSAFAVIAHFLKASFMPLHFYKRPVLVPVFNNRKKPKEDFCFREERRKQKIAYSICFQGAIIEAASILSVKSGTTEVLPWELHSKPQHHVSIPVNCACEHLCLILNYSGAPISKMCPKVVASSLYIIWTYERFHRSHPTFR